MKTTNNPHTLSTHNTELWKQASHLITWNHPPTQTLTTTARDGGYGEAAPQEDLCGDVFLPQALLIIGSEPRFITAELTAAASYPAMADLMPPPEQSRASAEHKSGGMWEPAMCERNI